MACDLSRAVQRYWADLKVGDLMETETRAGGSRVTSTAEVVSEKGTLVLRVTERTEDEARPKAALSNGSTFVMVPPGAGPAKLIETRWTFDGDRPTKPRTEEVELAAGANRLPGLPAYCVEGPATGSEELKTAAGVLACKTYGVQESKLWVSPEVPFGGLVKTTSEGGGEKLESIVTKARKGAR